jgi:hypothetical protein
MIACNRCGHEWATDPAYAAPCNECNAGSGKPCGNLAPSEHRKNAKFAPIKGFPFHAARDMGSAALGAYCHPCDGKRHGKCSTYCPYQGDGASSPEPRQAHQIGFGTIDPDAGPREGAVKSENADSRYGTVPMF